MQFLILKAREMNVLSLFDGISCGRIALDRAGINVENYYAAEVDKYAIKITTANWPKTQQMGDVTKWREWDIDWSSIDLLIGGSPCQGFSFAGKQLAFDDPRSALFFEYLNILNHIKSVNPNVKFMLENVKMKKEYLDAISSMLKVEPVFINSALVSAQNRQRYYWANWDFKQPNDKGILLDSILDDAFSNREKSYCIDANFGKGGNLRRYFFRSSRQLVFSDKVFLDDILTNKPNIGDINQIGSGNRGKWRILSVSECERLQNIPVGYTNHVSKVNRYKSIGNGWTVDVVAHILKGFA
jgi:site-specific DNA-cytosine methylase